MRLLLIILISFALISPVSMQETTEPSVACDYTLITLMLVAMHDYGYVPPLAFDQYSLGMYADQPATAESDGPTVRDEVENAVNQTATQVAESGFPGVSDVLGEVADEAGELAEAGQTLFEAGRDAFEAGRESLEGNDVDQTGALPNESEECTALREDLLNFFFAYLTGAVEETE